MSVRSLAALVAASTPPPGVSGTGTGFRAILVCDGTAGGLAKESPEPVVGPNRVEVRIMFAGPGRDADSLIEHLLEVELLAKRASGCLVVSSDKRVQQAARGVRAKALPSREFLILLGRTLTSPARGREIDDRPEFARQTPLDPATTRWWMRTFGFALEGEPQSPPAASITRPAPRALGPAPTAAGSHPTNPPPRPQEASVPNGVDPLLAQALQTWAGRLELDDLDMSRWLDDSPPPDRPPEDPRPTRGSRARRKPRSG